MRLSEKNRARKNSISAAGHTLGAKPFKYIVYLRKERNAIRLVEISGKIGGSARTTAPVAPACGFREVCVRLLAAEPQAAVSVLPQRKRSEVREQSLRCCRGEFLLCSPQADRGERRSGVYSNAIGHWSAVRTAQIRLEVR